MQGGGSATNQTLNRSLSRPATHSHPVMAEAGLPGQTIMAQVGHEYFRKALTVKPNYARAQYSIVKVYIQIAATFSKENENVDHELSTLRALDTKLAAELDDYRKNYKAGLLASPVKLDQ